MLEILGSVWFWAHACFDSDLSGIECVLMGMVGLQVS